MKPDNPIEAPSWRAHLDPPVFFGSGLSVLIVVAFAVAYPDSAAGLFKSLQTGIVERFGWLYMLAVAGFLVFVGVLALSPLGRIRLGPDHSRPDYGYLSWFSMLFSAGMGIGLMFFGVAEPIMHYVEPPRGEAATVEAARQAMRITFFHWGVHAWAIYAVVGLSLAYFCYRHGLPLRIRSSLYPLIGDRIHGPIGSAIDILAVWGTLFGVATSLGLGVVQVNAGLAYLYDVPTSVGVQIGLIASITAIATVSVVLGLDVGIRRISELNMILAAALLLFVLVFGPTTFLLQALVQNTGMYLSSLFRMTFDLHAYQPSGWVGGWTLFYWGWWIAWSPFVGMFIARISRGRTIREFVAGVLLVPTGFTFLWMTVFGGSALHLVMLQGASGLADAVAADAAVALFGFLEYLPLNGLISLLATVLVITFFVTSSDSGSLVVDMLASGGRDGSPTWQRVFWAALEGMVAAVLLLAGGLGALQTAAIASALPFVVVLILMCVGLQRALWQDAHRRQRLDLSQSLARRAGGDWRLRLRGIVRQPTRQDVVAFIATQVRPTLLEVAGELESQGLRAAVESSADSGCRLRVHQHDQGEFSYAVRVCPDSGSTSARGGARPSPEGFRAEVHLGDGSQGYDLMGSSNDRIAADVLDQYQHHLDFLAQMRSDALDGAAAP